MDVKTTGLRETQHSEAIRATTSGEGLAPDTLELGGFDGAPLEDVMDSSNESEESDGEGDDKDARKSRRSKRKPDSGFSQEHALEARHFPACVHFRF